MNKNVLLALTGAVLLGIGMGGTAEAASFFTVKAFENSSSYGTGLATGLSFSAGQKFSVTVDPTDLWNAGPLPR
jgi:hypothetical protein